MQKELKYHGLSGLLCCSLYYVIGSYLLLLVANILHLYPGVKRAEQQRALKGLSTQISVSKRLASYYTYVQFK